MDFTEMRTYISEYTGLLFRRKWAIILLLGLGIISAIIYLMITPKMYMASTTILVTPQKIPVDYVRATVTSGVEARIQSISQEILSRSRLEPLINELNLYSGEIAKITKEEIVEMMRKDIKINVGGREGYFNISYVGKEPTVVARVANRISALYIEENLKMREQQAQGTSEFMQMELKLTKDKLEQQEMSVTEFKKKYMTELPEQQGTNLQIMHQLQLDHQRISDTLKSAQDRKVIIQKQLSEMRKMEAVMGNAIEEEDEPEKKEIGKEEILGKEQSKIRTKTPDEIQLEQFKNQINDLKSKYTEKHPDIISMKRKVTELERKIKDSENKEGQVSVQGQERSQTQGEVIAIGRGRERKEKTRKMDSGGPNIFSKEMEDQLAATDQEIKRIIEEDSKIRKKIGEYQARVENSPNRELAMTGLMRDYNNTKQQYEILLRKLSDAQQAENLERRQKGEQFRIIDPARIPEKPYKPNNSKTLGIGAGIGLMLGLGFAWYRETMNQGYHSESEIEKIVGINVIAVIPNIKEESTKNKAA